LGLTVIDDLPEMIGWMKGECLLIHRISSFLSSTGAGLLEERERGDGLWNTEKN